MGLPSDRYSLTQRMKAIVLKSKKKVPKVTVSFTCVAEKGLRLTGALAQTGDSMNRYTIRILLGAEPPRYWESATFSDEGETFIRENGHKNMNISLQLPADIALSLRERAIAARVSQAELLRRLLYLE